MSGRHNTSQHSLSSKENGIDRAVVPVAPSLQRQHFLCLKQQNSWTWDMTASLGSILMREMGGGTQTTPQNKKALLPQNEQHLLFLDGTQSIRGFRAKVKMP